MNNVIIYDNTTNNRIKVEMKYYVNYIMNSIIYCVLDESKYESVLIHDLRKAPARNHFEHQWMDMEYHFTICDVSNDFESQYHMSVEA